MHPNEQLLRDADQAQLSGDVEAFLAFFSDDVVGHVGGHSSVAGDYRGKDEFVAGFQRFQERAPEYTFEPHAYFADDEHGVILQRSRYKRGDEVVDASEAFVCHFGGGKITEFWLMTYESDAVDDFLG